MTNNLKPGERLDDLQIKGYEIIQSPGRFCFGMDAVFLSAFAKVKAGECVLDLGTGTGILPILLAAKTKGKHFTGLEIQEESADMACRSVRHNRLEEQIDIVTGDIKEASQIFGKGSMDVITTNPPYMIGGHGMANPESAKAIARHEVLCTLEDIIRESARILKAGGRFYMVHRPERFVDIMAYMRQYKIEPKEIRFVCSHNNEMPKLVLIKGVKNAKPFLKIKENLNIYDKDGNYTEEILKIYNKI